ncbi:hypothetical protein C8Q80DRAFT_119048 [Daedaleopsis nitida]|nr:hypothetical protein C8Q80DRAFT_119048 [Daedaleopsis nitida]
MYYKLQAHRHPLLCCGLCVRVCILTMCTTSRAREILSRLVVHASLLPSSMPLHLACVSAFTRVPHMAYPGCPTFTLCLCLLLPLSLALLL